MKKAVNSRKLDVSSGAVNTVEPERIDVSEFLTTEVLAMQHEAILLSSFPFKVRKTTILTFLFHLFQFKTCNACEGFYGTNFSQPVCGTCHYFLFPSDINLPEDVPYAEVSSNIDYISPYLFSHRNPEFLILLRITCQGLLLFFILDACNRKQIQVIQEMKNHVVKTTFM